MRKLIATVFNNSLDGLLADEGTEFWDFCFGLPENREPNNQAQLDFLETAYAHIMGRTAYEGISRSMTANTDHPFSPILNAARKVVFSRTLKTADWTNTTIASVTLSKRSTNSDSVATATSSRGAASISSGRSCSSTRSTSSG
jgi:dihydrofolate reductase